MHHGKVDIYLPTNFLAKLMVDGKKILLYLLYFSLKLFSYLIFLTIKQNKG